MPPRSSPPRSSLFPEPFASEERGPSGGRTLWPRRGGGGGGGDGRAVQGRQDGREQRHGSNDKRWHLAVLHEPMRRPGGVTSPQRQTKDKINIPVLCVVAPASLALPCPALPYPALPCLALPYLALLATEIKSALPLSPWLPHLTSCTAGILGGKEEEEEEEEEEETNGKRVASTPSRTQRGDSRAHLCASSHHEE
ncbi:hypothetical protein O3P69_010143 [Scylla paramamosain]|uniref:Uncharacterized protein n=1 Tax=Scylla paramamosain TaxID=85552 RepID=A0AAW0TRX2_SCYPA